jgi:hypothetical protein
MTYSCGTAARPASAATPKLAAGPVGKCTLRRIYVSVTASLRRRRVETRHTFSPTKAPSVTRTRSSRRTGLCGVNPTGTSSAYLSRSTQTTRRGRSDARLAGDLLSRRAPRQGPARWPSRRGGELPVGYDARGWLDAQAVKTSQVKLVQHTVKPPLWPRQATDGPPGLIRCRRAGL